MLTSTHFQLIGKSKYQKIFYNQVYQTLYVLWDTPFHMYELDFRLEVDSYFVAILDLRPKKIVLDTRYVNYSAIPETQDWIIKQYSHIYRQIGLKKLAIVNSRNCFAQISFEQIMKYTPQDNFEFRFYREPHEALTWVDIEYDILDMIDISELTTQFERKD